MVAIVSFGCIAMCYLCIAAITLCRLGFFLQGSYNRALITRLLFAVLAPKLARGLAYNAFKQRVKRGFAIETYLGHYF